MAISLKNASFSIQDMSEVYMNNVGVSPLTVKSDSIAAIIEQKIYNVKTSIVRLCRTSNIDTRSWVLAIGNKQFCELLSSPLPLMNFNIDPLLDDPITKYEKRFGITILKVDQDDFLEILAYL